MILPYASCGEPAISVLTAWLIAAGFAALFVAFFLYWRYDNAKSAVPYLRYRARQEREWAARPGRSSEAASSARRYADQIDLNADRHWTWPFTVREEADQ